MGGLSIWHWLIFGVVAVVLFGGGGKLSSILGDAGKGIKEFKKGLTEDDKPAPPVAQPAPAPVANQTLPPEHVEQRDKA